VIELIVFAILIAVGVGLLCILAGRVIATLAAPIAVTIGGYLEQFGWVIGMVVGLFYFVTGGSLPRIK
jgi:hypothetical protein